MIKNNIEIHLIFSDNVVIRFTTVQECYHYLCAHYSFLYQDNNITREDVLLGVLSSGLSTEDETFINRQVTLNQEFQTRSSTDDKIIQ